MKIIVIDPALGKFEWDMPENISAMQVAFGKALREEMRLSEDLAVKVEQENIEVIQNQVRSFLHLILATHLVGGVESVLLIKMVQDGMVDLSSRTLEFMRFMRDQD